MKPVNLNLLLSQPKSLSLSFFWPAMGTEEKRVESFLQGLLLELEEDHPTLAKVLSKRKSSVIKILRSHPDKSHGFFFSETFEGYIILESTVTPFVSVAPSFHLRALLQEFFLNPEFVLINISAHDVRVFRGDFHHLEISQHYDFDQHGKENFSGIFHPGQGSVIPYRTVLALNTIAKKIMDKNMYHSMPVIVTGHDEYKKQFLKSYEHHFGIISHLDDDFFEKTCVEIMERSKIFRPLVMDFHSAGLRDRLKKLMRSKLLLSDLESIVKAAPKGDVIQLVLPSEKKLWGHVDFSTGHFEVHKRIHKKNPSVDILNELAEEVMRQGGKIEILGQNFFPPHADVLALLKGSA